MNTTWLYRPVGPKELALIVASNYQYFPPRLAEQPIFYPVLNADYAMQIAKAWNVKESGAGFVTGFAVDNDYLCQFSIQQVGGKMHQELWIPAEELDNFNKHIVGYIEIIAEFYENNAKN